MSSCLTDYIWEHMKMILKTLILLDGIMGLLKSIKWNITKTGEEWLVTKFILALLKQYVCISVFCCLFFH